MRSLLKRISRPFFKIGLKYYYSKPRKFSFDGVSVLIHPDVFPPYFTYSTKILLNFLKPLNIQGKSLLELGCGSGIISLYAAKKGAKVTATDINKIAIDYLKNSSEHNDLTIEILYSDLFENLNNRNFDYILINPPYFPKDPDTIKEHAWFCGSNFDYFERLFLELRVQKFDSSSIYMILSQDCDIDKITQIAQKNKHQLTTIKKVSSWMESNYIYKIETVS